MKTTLYAWAKPVEALSGFVDHTWVTNYKFKNGQYKCIKDIPSEGAYWYCWGVYHDSANGGVNHNPNGAIGSHLGSQKIASELVKPNVASPGFPGDDHDPQVGSIFYYAVDGVCHTVANQVLFATGSPTELPLLVTQARGYNISSFFYGDYGLNSKVWNSSVQKYAPNFLKPDDYFSKHLNSMEFSNNQIITIQNIRKTAQNSFIELHPKVPTLSKNEIYIQVGAIIYLALEAINLEIGVENFFKLFPSFNKIPTNKEEATYWIDQMQLEHSVDTIHRLR